MTTLALIPTYQCLPECGLLEYKTKFHIYHHSCGAQEYHLRHYTL